MRRVLPTGLRGRLMLAMSLVALGSLAVGAFVADRVLRAQVDRVRLEDMRFVARSAAAETARVYRIDNGYSQRFLSRIGQTVAIGDGELTLLDADGRVLVGEDPAKWRAEQDDRPVASRLVMVDGRVVGTVLVRPAIGPASRDADEKRSIDSALLRTHLLAGLVTLPAALLAALLVSGDLTRPVRRLTDALRRAENSASREPIEVPGATGEVALLAAAYNRLISSLAREERLRRQAAAFVAHELRTPISGVLTRLEAMQDGMLPLSEDNLTAVRRDAERLRQLVDSVERLHQAEQPLRPRRTVPVELEILAASRTAAVVGDCVRRGVSLSGTFEPACVDGDVTRLEQVVDNLLSNALRYTERGGSVDVRVESADGEAKLEVADTGVGIEAEELAHVFEPFWRSERSRSSVPHGSGLGLAITRELVDAHGGRITVESHPGQGTTIRVMLPLSKERTTPTADGNTSDGDSATVPHHDEVGHS